MQDWEMIRGAGRMRFESIDVWKRSNFFTSDGKGGERLMKMYTETVATEQVKRRDMTGLGKYSVAARDQAPCQRCDGCKQQSEPICKNNWYPAYLSIFTVIYGNSPEKVVIVSFPGYAPKRENRGSPLQLLTKHKTQDDLLKNDINIRVFCWNELDQLAGQIGLLSK
jgi:hypothetical protein